MGTYLKNWMAVKLNSDPNVIIVFSQWTNVKTMKSTGNTIDYAKKEATANYEISELGTDTLYFKDYVRISDKIIIKSTGLASEEDSMDTADVPSM